MNNTVSIKVNGQVFTGWQTFKLTRGLEIMPSNFEVTSVGNPAQDFRLKISSGSACQVYIGSDLVLTGYIGPITRSISANDHTITISGYSKCIDIVLCSAVLNASYHKDNDNVMGNGIVTGTINSIARQLCAPNGIDVIAKESVDTNLPQPEYVNAGESAFTILERIARYSAVILYDDPTGNLVINDVGKQSQSSGFSLVNISKASALEDQTNRYSDYWAVWQSFNALRDIGASNKHGYAADAGVGRFKPMIVVSEQNINGTDLAQKKADWLMNRNIGRSQAINIESVGPNAWRDSAGNLFQPNMIAPVHVPILEVIKQTWLISEVTYDFGVETGTKLSATLMPASAFAVEPDIQNNPLAQFSGGQS